MSDWTGIREARDLPGLRLVLLRGFPSPWSPAARGIFELKKVPFIKVHQTTENYVPFYFRLDSPEQLPRGYVWR